MGHYSAAVKEEPGKRFGCSLVEFLAHLSSSEERRLLFACAVHYDCSRCCFTSDL